MVLEETSEPEIESVVELIPATEPVSDLLEAEPSPDPVPLDIKSESVAEAELGVVPLESVTEVVPEFELTQSADLGSKAIPATPSTYADLLTSYTQREPGYFDNEFTPEFVEAKLNTPDPIVPSNPQAFGESIDRWVMTEAISQGLSREETLNLVVEQSPYVAKLSSEQDLYPSAFETYMAPGGSLEQELNLVLSKAPEQTPAFEPAVQVTEAIQLGELINESGLPLEPVTTEMSKAAEPEIGTMFEHQLSDYEVEPESFDASDAYWEGPTADELDAVVDHSLSYYEAPPFLEHPQSLETVQVLESIGENNPDLSVALDVVTETSLHESVPESIPALHAVQPLSESVLVQAVASDQSSLSYSPYLATASENSQIAQLVESINKPLDVPLDPQAQQAALTVHFSALPDAINRVDVLNGALASAEPRLQSLQDGFTAVEFEIKNLAQHINEGKFSDWASTQGKRVETAAQTMTKSVKGRFSQWMDNAKSAAKDKVQEVGQTLMDKFEKAVALVDSNKLEAVAPVLPSQVENYKIETEQGLRISRDGVPIFEDGKCTPNISTWDSVFIKRLSDRAEKNVSSMVEGLATLGGEVQPNGDRTFSVGAYTMSRAENGAVKLNETSRGEILRAHNGKIRSSMTAEDYSRFQKFQQNTQVAVKAPAMAKGGIELG